jgi:glycosyltransferase involved in cell wall biosynthesis
VNPTAGKDNVYASVIVPTFNRQAVLERTLIALTHQTLPMSAFEIVVVDDNSLDNTPEVATRFQSTLPSLRYIRHKENCGRVVTRNDGILNARGDLLVFLDDDNIPSPNFVEAHVKCHEKAHPQHIAVMGNVTFEMESVNKSNFARYMNAQYLGHRPARARLGFDYSDLPAKFFGTLNSSARRDDVVRVGMFDSYLRFYGGEDFLMGYRLKGSGVRIVFEAEARTTHCDAVTIDRYREKYRETAREGLSLIHAKDPCAIEATGIKLLLPVRWRMDPLTVVLKKVMIRFLLNRFVVFALELWAKGTDRNSVCYSSSCFRALQVAWYLQGLRSKVRGIGTVRYDPS